ncbi:PAS domain-containing protein [Sorangium sp. So ce233]|uniref:PAS domain-containing protein n=1 Tax=Sorangium sp. So ce233 TaxID=3133290 RepID=UPI003F639976
MMGARLGSGANIASENDALRRRVAELERELAEVSRRERDAQQRLMAHEAMFHAMPAMMFIKDREHRYLYVNQAYAAWYGKSRDEILGRTDAEIFPAAIADVYRENDEGVMASGEGRQNVELCGVRADGGELWTLESHVAYRDTRGEVRGMAGVALDVTERKRMETALREREAQLDRLVQRQEWLLATIAELSAPVLPVEDDVLVVPLVGHLDVERTARVQEALLAAVERQRARFVILDLTGVPAVDAAVAERLTRVARAAGLLGAQVSVTGVSPAIARELVELGADLRTLVFRGDVRVALRHALARRAQPQGGRRAGASPLARDRP